MIPPGLFTVVVLDRPLVDGGPFDDCGVVPAGSVPGEDVDTESSGKGLCSPRYSWMVSSSGDLPPSGAALTHCSSGSGAAHCWAAAAM